MAIGSSTRHLSLRDRLDLYISQKPSGCWIWTGSTNGKGYGRVSVSGRMMVAHRVVYELYVGSIQKGLKLLHSCDTSLCVNPGHLFQGTQFDNIRDMFNKGRNPIRIGQSKGVPRPKSSQPGERHPLAKLTAHQVLEIRAARDVPTGRLAKTYGVSRSTIRLVIRRERWAHIP